MTLLIALLLVFIFAAVCWVAIELRRLQQVIRAGLRRWNSDGLPAFRQPLDASRESL